jgi:hypothetical protein
VHVAKGKDALINRVIFKPFHGFEEGIILCL